jgi:hypothetical protein
LLPLRKAPYSLKAVTIYFLLVVIAPSLLHNINPNPPAHPEQRFCLSVTGKLAGYIIMLAQFFAQHCTGFIQKLTLQYNSA